MNNIIIIGAGPAGLTAAYELAKRERSSKVLEKSGHVGGIARTESYKGYRFDIGGHRFYTKIKEVENIWRELLGDDFLERPRISRIYYQGKFYHYPLKLSNTLMNLGIFTSFAVGLSYLQSQLFPYPEENTFEEWVSNRFGKKLYSIFFETYTEKVWGMPCSEISAEWAAQRIKGLSLPVAVRNALFRYPDGKVKTLINSFEYPCLGPGMMWEAAQRYVEERGGEVQLNTPVQKLVHDGKRVLYAVAMRGQAAGQQQIPGSHFISSMPISELIKCLEPSAPSDILAAANDLAYRDFLTVVLILDRPELFPDNWIYVHEPEVRIGRIQNFKNWSPDMVPDLSKTSLGLEYFCSVGDDLWQMEDEALIALGKRELEQIGLASAQDVIDGVVVRQPKAYPIYNSTYQEHLEEIKDYLAGFENLQTIGRNGMHKYNNQDLSKLAGILAARNLLGETHDIWDVNTDQVYYEEKRVYHDALASDLR
ncbi:MAG: NAD(P)/FAD-dependent oxidoreductase [Anaerolineales bacterium]